jgi:hypothetical protein
MIDVVEANQTWSPRRFSDDDQEMALPLWAKNYIYAPARVTDVVDSISPGSPLRFFDDQEMVPTLWAKNYIYTPAGVTDFVDSISPGSPLRFFDDQG